MVRRLIVALLASLPGGCQTTAEAARPDIAAVAATLRGLIAADNAGDAGRVAAHYAADAVLMPPGGAIVVGRDEIRRRYAAGFGRFRLEVSLQSLATRVAGDLAVDRGVTRGAFVWHDGRPPTPFEDQYLMVLERSADGWRVAVLMWSPTGRAVAHPPPSMP